MICGRRKLQGTATDLQSSTRSPWHRRAAGALGAVACAINGRLGSPKPHRPLRLLPPPLLHSARWPPILARPQLPLGRPSRPVPRPPASQGKATSRTQESTNRRQPINQSIEQQAAPPAVEGCAAAAAVAAPAAAAAAAAAADADRGADRGRGEGGWQL
eukprot:scaffold5824_cov373-Prasinococcus_capsulatus_cf.AAC.7